MSTFLETLVSTISPPGKQIMDNAIEDNNPEKKEEYHKNLIQHGIDYFDLNEWYMKEHVEKTLGPLSKAYNVDAFLTDDGKQLRKQLDSFDKDGNPIKVDNPITMETGFTGRMQMAPGLAAFLGNHSKGFKAAEAKMAKENQQVAAHWERKRQGFIDAAKSLGEQGKKMAGEGFKYDLLGDM